MATTVTLKLNSSSQCYCSGHKKEVDKALSKVKGVDSKSINWETGIVTVEGSMALTDLERRFKKKFKKVQIISVHKKGENKVEKDGKKREGEVPSSSSSTNATREAAPEPAPQGGNLDATGRRPIMSSVRGETQLNYVAPNQGSYMDANGPRQPYYMGQNYPNNMGSNYPYNMVPNYSYFSDENPNGCSIM